MRWLAPSFVPGLTNGRNSGFLRYWTVSNVPLFILATPMLCILLYSCYWAFVKIKDSHSSGEKASRLLNVTVFRVEVLKRLALPQLLLAVLALTNLHVQIITRLASGYPLWYLWQANLMVQDQSQNPAGKKKQVTELVMKWMVLYGLVQAALYSSFLPPA